MPAVKASRVSTMQRIGRRAEAPSERTHCFGSHLSIAGGMHRAIDEALRLGFDTVQVFVKNQRQWRAAPLDEAELARWRERAAKPGFGPVVAHATYLINLASGDDSLWLKSCEAFESELLRCDALGIAYLVVHPGSAGAQPLDAAILRVSAALNTLLARQPQVRTMVLLETTAGQGTTLGRSFEQLGQVLALLREPQRVGVCIDTCHVFAAGYDIREPAKYEAMIGEAGRTVGLERIRCWHLNDSRGDVGSRLDRHEHIGKGRIGGAGFRNVLTDVRFIGQPMILETPKDEDGSGALDRMNLRTLRRLAKRVGAATTRR